MKISKTIRFVEGTMEGAWLVAVILLPSYFNKYSAMSYQPDKVTALRSLVLVMLAAWLVKIIEQNGITWRALRTDSSAIKTLMRMPLILPIFVIALVDVISLIFTVTPLVSFWGDYTRLQGLYTTISYMLVFAVMAVNLRRRVQLDRLITTLIITSIPVCVYAIGQRYNIDPIIMTSSEYETFRVTSTLGAPVFLAAYLIMIFPLTIMRIAHSVYLAVKERSKRLSSIVLASFYTMLSIAQLIVIIFTASRGPFIGLTMAMVFYVLLFSIYWRKRWLVFAGIGLGAALVAFLLVMNIPNGPLQSLKANPTLDRLAKIFDPEAAISSTRDRYWQMAAELYTTTKPLEFADGSKDGLIALRPLVGYGPDALAGAVSSVYRYEIVTINRFHNEVWDILFTKGALGLLSQIAFLAIFFYYGLKWLGLVQTGLQRKLYWTTYTGGILLGAVGLGLWRGWIYVALGLEVGFVIGPFVYLALLSFGKIDPHKTGEYDRWALVMMALIAAVLAHTVEVGFSFKIETTFTFFWIYTAMVLLIGYILPLNENPNLVVEVAAVDDVPEDRKLEKGHLQRRGKGKTARRTVSATGLWKYQESIISGIVIGVMLLIYAFDYIHPWVGSGFTGGQIFWDSLTRLPGKGNITSPFVIGLALVFWTLATVVYTLENHNQDSERRIPVLGVTLLVSGGIALIYSLGLSEYLASLNRYEASAGRDNLARVIGYETLLVTFDLIVFGLILALAGILPERKSIPKSAANRVTILMIPVIVVLLFITVSYLNLNVMLGNISASKAEEKSQPMAVTIYQRAIRQAPMEPEYWLLFGNYYSKVAATTQNIQERERFLLEGVNVLKTGQALKLLDLRFAAKLSEIYSNLAYIQTDPAKREDYGRTADGYYATVVRMSPYYYRMWTSWALNDLRNLNKPDEAKKKLEQSLKINSSWGDTQALLGAYYWSQINALKTDEEKRKALETAVSYYLTALKIDSKQYNYHLDLAKIYSQMGSNTQAIDSYLKAAQNSPNPNPDLWKIYWTVGTIYFQTANYEQAVASTTAAIQISPKPNPDLWRLYTYLGDSHRMLKNNDNALEAYNNALSNNPDPGLVWRIEEVLAQIYLAQGKKAPALEHVGMAIRQAPEENKAALKELEARITNLP